MSLHITHRTGALVVSAVAALREDCLAQITAVLDNLVAGADHVVLDLSDVLLAPSARVTAFMDHLARLSASSECRIVVVAERLSARRILHAAAPPHSLDIAPSLEAALGEPPRVPDPRPVPTPGPPSSGEGPLVGGAAPRRSAQ